jgi:hypothetical protein
LISGQAEIYLGPNGLPESQPGPNLGEINSAARLTKLFVLKFSFSINSSFLTIEIGFQLRKRKNYNLRFYVSKPK